MSDDEKFFAWLDGELGQAEAAEVEAKVAADPHLQQLAMRHRALAGALRDAFVPVLAAPIPERLQSAVRPGGNVIDFAAAKRSRTFPAAFQWAAMAATLAVGVLAGTLIPRSAGGPVEAHAGKLYAAAGLDRALDAQLASVPSGDVRIGITFRDRAGAICRSFTAAAASGLACRDGDRWRVRGIFAAPEGQSSDYRMAAGMDPSLAALVDSTMAGEPFDATAERAARERGWR
jgi:hypothetical protein